MSEWKKVKLGDLATKITKGTTPSNIGESFCDRGIPFIRSELITQNKYISDEGILYISKQTHEKLKRSQLEANDILFSMAGVYLGKTAILRECDVPANTNQAVALIRLDSTLCNVDYVYYYLNKESVIRYVNQISGQAAQPNINLQQIGGIPIVLPSIKEQETIATILSRYDSLIENYQKQIKLLDEAAQRLYKEWFVDLRFLGYENTKIVDGVPEGWEKKTLDSFCNVFTGKKNANQGVPNGEYKFFTCGDTPLLINSFIYDGPAIIISGNGSYTGRATFYEGKFDLYQRTYACTIKDTKNSDLIYGLYEIVKCELTNKISGGTHGAAIPYIVMSDLTTFDFLYNESIMQSFSVTIKRLLSTTLNLSNNIRFLTEARDRLLPKLMSGELL